MLLLPATTPHGSTTWHRTLPPTTARSSTAPPSPSRPSDSRDHGTTSIGIGDTVARSPAPRPSRGTAACGDTSRRLARSPSLRHSAPRPGTALASTGAATTARPVGQTLTIAATGGGTGDRHHFGSGTGQQLLRRRHQVSTLDQLNTALAANNLQATIDSDRQDHITTTNDAASSTIGAIAGTAPVRRSSRPVRRAAPVADANAQTTRGRWSASTTTR